MAKKVSDPIVKPKHNCLACENGTIGAYNLIYCTHCVIPQPIRDRFCTYYKSKKVFLDD